MKIIKKEDESELGKKIKKKWGTNDWQTYWHSPHDTAKIEWWD